MGLTSITAANRKITDEVGVNQTVTPSILQWQFTIAKHNILTTINLVNNLPFSPR